MAIIINDNFAVNTGKPVDSKYMNISTPWTSTAAVNAGIPVSYRYIGLTVNINSVEYWYQNGITDIDLVVKAGSSGVISAINGIHLVGAGTGVSLGGVLTGNTVFDGGFPLYHLKYGSDYSAAFTPRSLVDKGYVTGLTSSLVAPTANNGLTKIGGNIRLGGLLTGATTISGATQSFSLGTSSSIINALSMCSVSTLICASTTISIHSSAASNGVRITAPVTGAIYNCDYSAGFVNESLVTKRYVDSRSNSYSVICVSTPTYNVTSTDEFIGVSGTTIIYLPLAPSVGHRLTISDICGNALNSGICVDGQGKRINDGSCSIASINTNFGSITFVYNGLFWSASAFVN